MGVWFAALVWTGVGVTVAPGDTVLVTTLKASELPAAEAGALTADVAAALHAVGSCKVMTIAEVDAMIGLQKDKRSLGCADEACIAELSRIASANLVLSGSVGRVGSEWTLSLALVDVTRSTRVAGSSRTARDLSALRELVGEAVRELAQAAFGGATTAARYHLPEGQTVSFAVLDLKPLGLDANAAGNLTEVLAAEIKSFGGTTVVSRSDIASMLQFETNKTLLGCDDTACLAEIGGALGVDQLVVGDVGKVGERFVVSLRIVDARNPAALSRVNESYEGLESQLVPAVKHAARALLGIEATTPGRIVVEGSQKEAVAKVDGVDVGLLPVTDMTELSIGRHRVIVSKPGFIDWRSDVYVAPGATTRVFVDLLEKPVRWVFWGFVGVTGVSALGGGLSALSARAQDQEAQRLLAAGKPGFMDRRTAAESWALAANVFWVSTAITAAGTLVAGLLTNWE